MKQITLANLAEATAQEVFDQVALHLLTQNKSSRNERNQCAYRAKDETGNILKCAAGCLISNEEMKVIEEFVDKEDGLTANFKSWRYLLCHNLVPNGHENLIDGLQTIHDGYDPRKWKDKLITMANRFHLNTDVIINF